MRPRYLVVGAIVLVGATAAASSVAARPDVKSGQADPPAGMLEQARPELMLGTGEQLVIVVNGRFGNEQAAAQAGARLAFGELQGFYVDRAANYRLLGYYEQTSPDRQTVDCLAPVDPSGGTCPDPERSWIAMPAVQLVYHPLDRAGPVQDPEPCGIINAPRAGRSSFRSSWRPPQTAPSAMASSSCQPSERRPVPRRSWSSPEALGPRTSSHFA